MKGIIELIINWWVSRPSNIYIEGISVSILPQHWMELSWVNFLGFTIIPVLISIFICYTLTNSEGRGFLIRWWLFLIVTSVIDAIIIFIFLKSKTFVAGLEDAPIYWKIPNFMILSRALVGFFQSILFYYLLSIVIVKLLGGWLNVKKFTRNLFYPYPRLFNA